MARTSAEAGPAIVGREPELAALQAFLAPERPGRALVIGGGPGVGKTPLEDLREARRPLARPAGEPARGRPRRLSCRAVTRSRLAAAVVLVAAALAAPTALGAPDQAASATRVVACHGSGTVCRARVSLARGASNERVVVRLTDTDLRLVSVKPNRRYLRGAYLVSNGRFRLGGSQYVFTLNAVQAIPVGSYLTLTFRA